MAGLILIAGCLAPVCAQKMGGPNTYWLPITDAEKAMTAPQVEKDAGVEALFWHTSVEDFIRGDDVERRVRHYVRLKVFNEKGKERIATVDIEAAKGFTIFNIAGRTIKPDGTVVELTRDAVHERDLVKAGRRKLHVKSFALPAVEVGSIVEYRWAESKPAAEMLYLRLEMQHEYPIQHMLYQVLPLPRELTSFQMSLMSFNCQPSGPSLGRDGFNEVALDNVPAFREEPHMPPPANLRPWALVYYHQDGARRDPEKYWNEVGKKGYQNLRDSLHSNDEIKAAAEKAIEGAQGDEQKTLALLRYVRKNFRSIYDRRVSAEERDKYFKHLPKNRERKASEIFKSEMGTADELNMLFAAMANAVKLETRPAFVPSNHELNFTPRLLDRYFLRSVDMAVRIDDKWRVYDVSARHLPPEMLSLQEEGVQALIGSPSKSEFITTPVAPPEASVANRKAEFNLQADGTLEGDVEISYTGHLAEEKRSEYEDQTDARQTEMVTDGVHEVFAQADVSAVKVEHFDDSEQPLLIRYHVKIPQYAQRTGKRLILQPLYFERGEAPEFESAERHNNIHFDYGWKEVDQVKIHWPDGFALDNAENPGRLNFGPPGYYDLRMQRSNQNDLIIGRDFIFGQKGFLHFPVEAYLSVKGAFDAIHARDGVSIALKSLPAPGQGAK